MEEKNGERSFFSRTFLGDRLVRTELDVAIFHLVYDKREDRERRMIERMEYKKGEKKGMVMVYMVRRRTAGAKDG